MHRISSGPPRFWSQLAALTGLLALLFAVLQPPPTAHLGFGTALLAWVLHIGIGMLCALAATAALLRSLPPLCRRPWLALLCAGLLGGLLFAPLALGLEELFPAAPSEPPQDWLDHWEMAGGVRAVVAEYLSLLPSYLAAWLLANTSPMLRVAQPQLALLENGQAELALSSQAPTIMLPAAEPTESPRLATPESEMSPVGATSKRPSSVMNPDLSARKDSLLERIPLAIGQQLISITADLHYLQITTRRGRTTILGSLTEAETELGECGLRIHRSHWIALDAVRRLRRTANGWRCELVNGRTLPVSRRRVAEAKLRLGSDFVVEDQEGGVVP